MRAPRCGSGPNCRLEGTPHPQGNWRTLPSSESPSLPTVPLFPHPPGTFRNAPGWATWAGVGEAAHGGGRGGSSKRHLGPDPHLGAFESDFLLVVTFLLRRFYRGFVLALIWKEQLHRPFLVAFSWPLSRKTMLAPLFMTFSWPLSGKTMFATLFFVALAWPLSGKNNFCPPFSSWPFRGPRFGCKPYACSPWKSLLIKSSFEEIARANNHRVFERRLDFGGFLRVAWSVRVSECRSKFL